MTREKRLRRAVLLCAHFTRNRAFYLAGWNGDQPRRQSAFWNTVNGNFMDIAVMEWCKLFADERGKHYWTRLVSDPGAFWPALLGAIGATQEEFEATREEMLKYRDKFVGHPDEEEVMHIPRLDLAWAATQYLHAHIVANEAEPDIFHGLPMDLNVFNDAMAHEGAGEYTED